ncbi:hypothetical protein PGB90_005763 [Kerria lacca]
MAEFKECNIFQYPTVIDTSIDEYSENFKRASFVVASYQKSKQRNGPNFWFSVSELPLIYKAFKKLDPFTRAESNCKEDPNTFAINGNHVPTNMLHIARDILKHFHYSCDMTASSYIEKEDYHMLDGELVLLLWIYWHIGFKDLLTYGDRQAQQKQTGKNKIIYSWSYIF